MGQNGVKAIPWHCLKDASGGVIVSQLLLQTIELFWELLWIERMSTLLAHLTHVI
jgi:hypothetical protein